MKKILLSVLAATAVISTLHAEGVVVKSKVATLEFSGTHYLGYTYTDFANESKTDSSKFETRRNYLQVKAFWNEKDYMRITLDTKQIKQQDSGANLDHEPWMVRLKYAYVYLDSVLPYTGVEFGQVHRPWIDYEEHHGWWYRSIAKTFVEESYGAHLSNSADLGVNFKTSTDSFSSEIGLFNGEGYHEEQEGNGLSAEWRLTGHLLGTGKKHVHMSDTYADVSFLGQMNDHRAGGAGNTWYGIHGVYNQPEFLVAAMYCKSDNDGAKFEGDGYSFNGEYRLMDKWSILGRYDNWTDKSTSSEVQRTETIAGLAYKYNKYVTFIGNVFSIDPNDTVSDDEETRVMFTTEVNW